MVHLSSTLLTALELIRAALRLFYISFVRSLPYALAAMLLLFAVTVGGALYILENQFDRTSILCLSAVLMLLCPACMAPLLYRVHAIAHGRTVFPFETLSRGLHCLLPCLVAGVVYLLAVGIGAAFLLLIFVCANMVVIHHDLTLRSALAKAAEPVALA